MITIASVVSLLSQEKERESGVETILWCAELSLVVGIIKKLLKRRERYMHSALLRLLSVEKLASVLLLRWIPSWASVAAKWSRK